MTSKITSADITAAAKHIGATPAHIKAVMDVEAAGKGFDSKGRPTILFEPHVFYRNLKGTARALAVSAGLAYKVWKKKYPKDSWPRFNAAVKIDNDAAIKSTSWGLGQILGENYKAAGYPSPSAFREGMETSEGEQLMAMVRFIKSNRLDDEIRDGRWAAFARGYNGPGYAKNRYDERLAAAFRKHGGGKTASRPETGEEVVIAQMGDNGPIVEEIQRQLTRTGFRTRDDGDFGGTTKRNVELFQLENSMRKTGRVDADTWSALQTVEDAVINPERANATKADLLEKSEIVGSADTLEKGAKATVATGAGIGIADQTGVLDVVKEHVDKVSEFRGVFDSLQPLVGLAKTYWWVLLLVGAFGVWYFARKIIAARVEDHRTARTI